MIKTLAVLAVALVSLTTGPALKAQDDACNSYSKQFAKMREEMPVLEEKDVYTGDDAAKIAAFIKEHNGFDGGEVDKVLVLDMGEEGGALIVLLNGDCVKGAGAFPAYSIAHAAVMQMLGIDGQTSRDPGLTPDPNPKKKAE